jgi:hypothetical protein
VIGPRHLNNEILCHWHLPKASLWGTAPLKDIRLVQDRDCLLIDGTGLFQQLLETITVSKKEMESMRSE